MPRRLAFTWSAGDKRHGLTLGEARAFVAACDEVGAAEETPLAGKIGWSGRLLSLGFAPWDQPDLELPDDFRPDADRRCRTDLLPEPPGFNPYDE